ncbi:MAG: dioxygenase family protein [Gammaproteobacteria bacterium]
MKDFTVENLTESVVEAYTEKASPRMKVVMKSLIEHLHAFARDVELTEAEWFEGIQFLTATGKMCDAQRQEFILLSDTLGLSMMVDAINHPKGGKGTESTVLGPFYVDGAPEVPSGSTIIKRDDGHEKVVIEGRVTDADGNPLKGATLDVWQTAGNELYDVQDPTAPKWNLRAKIIANDDGSYSFLTETPQSYPVPNDGPVGQLLAVGKRHPMRPAHVHFIVRAEGYQPLTTHIFVAGDKYLDSDAVFATKHSLVVNFDDCSDSGVANRYGLSGPFKRAVCNFGLMTA